jgi:hypothetical protein
MTTDATMISVRLGATRPECPLAGVSGLSR